MILCHMYLYMTPERSLPGRPEAELPSRSTPWTCIIYTYCCYLIKLLLRPCSTFCWFSASPQQNHSKEGERARLECEPHFPRTIYLSQRRPERVCGPDAQGARGSACGWCACRASTKAARLCWSTWPRWLCTLSPSTRAWMLERSWPCRAPQQAAPAGRALRGKRGHNNNISMTRDYGDRSPPCLTFEALNNIHFSAQRSCARPALRARAQLLSSGPISAAASLGASQRPDSSWSSCGDSIRF